MNEIEIIIFTACATLIGGTILLIVTEIIKIFFVRPIQSLREHLPIVLSRLDFHCNMLTNFFPKNPTDDQLMIIRTIKKDLREAATNLNSQYKMIPFKKFFAILKLIPQKDSVDIAYGSLIFLHNSILYEGRREYVTNNIEINQNNIDRIHAALTNDTIPPSVKPIEEKKQRI